MVRCGISSQAATVQAQFQERELAGMNLQQRQSKFANEGGGAKASQLTD